MTKNNGVKEPLFHIVKKNDVPLWQAWLIRIGTIVFAIFIGGIIASAFSSRNPFEVIASLFAGAFGTKRTIWLLLQDTSMLLIIALAITPAFKMKFWNLGANGQVLISCLATIACMFFLGGKLPDVVVILIMIVAGLLAGVIWAVIPAIFKAFFGTNESLFTLMLNYIAEGLVAFFINVWVKDGSAVLRPIEYANLPELGNKYILIILVAALLTAFSYVYFRFSKHGYEVSVVGESRNTARYIGVDVKKVIIRTLVLSGLMCGVAGILLGGAINHTITPTAHNNLGFTAIMAAWLGKFNPLYVLVSSAFICFVTRGMVRVNMDCGFTSTAMSNIVIGIVYFFVIACEFFINYKLVFRSKKEVK